MLPDRVSNPGPLTYESGALPIALRGPATRSTASIATLQVWTLALSCCSKTPIESLSRLFTDGGSQLLMGKKSNIITPFVSQNTVAITLPAFGYFELLWPRGPRPYPLTTRSFILWLIIMNPSFVYSHQTQKKINF